MPVDCQREALEVSPSIALDALKEKYKQIYQFVFVDEFQDLNLPQIVLLQMLCEEGRITVCGDPDQSIYGFRGAYGSLGFTTFLPLESLV